MAHLLLATKKPLHFYSIAHLAQKSKPAAPIPPNTNRPSLVARAAVLRRYLIASLPLAGSGLLDQVDAHRTSAAEVHPPGTCHKLRSFGDQNRAPLRLIIASHPFRQCKA
jgi:hypothetical protein